ncbi:MAG: ankyrin repeat domain-containing protein [Alphaproteobacteria bacterium]|nr:ankyrin repeat domain-containing protein [Alphaproteobacteria bacterium]
MNRYKNAREILQRYLLGVISFGFIAGLGVVPAFCAIEELYALMPTLVTARNIITNQDISVQEFEQIYREAKDNPDSDLSLLLPLCVTITQKSSGKTTVLEWAALRGDANLVERLFAYDPDIMKQCEGESALLHYATRQNHVNVAKILFRHGIALDAVKNGLTPLHISACYGCTEVAEFLLDNGAMVDLMGDKGWTPLYLASVKNHLGVMFQLLHHGAKVDLGCGDIGYSALHMAVVAKSVDGINLLLDHHATIDVGSDGVGIRPLLVAVENNFLKGAEVLLKRGAVVDHTYGGRTALFMATQYDYADMARLLLKYGANVNFIGEMGSSPLHMAAWFDSADVAVALIQGGAAIDHPDEDGLTPLHWAVMRGKEKMVGVLLDHLAAVDLASNKGLTPLYYAVDKNYLPIARLLLDKGADVSKPSTSYALSTPLVHAFGVTTMDMFRLLWGYKR